jgi:hypothetical protein
LLEVGGFSAVAFEGLAAVVRGVAVDFDGEVVVEPEGVDFVAVDAGVVGGLGEAGSFDEGSESPLGRLSCEPVGVVEQGFEPGRSGLSLALGQEGEQAVRGGESEVVGLVEGSFPLSLWVRWRRCRAAFGWAW